MACEEDTIPNRIFLDDGGILTSDDRDRTNLRIKNKVIVLHDTWVIEGPQYVAMVQKVQEATT